MRSLVRWCAAPLISAIALEATGAQLPAGEACQTIVWATPDTLRMPSGRAVFVEHPQIVRSGVGTVLIGMWGAEVDSQPRALTAGYVIADDGNVRSIPLPIAFPTWGTPRAIAEPGGTVTVLWAPDDSTRRAGAQLRVAELRAEDWGPISSIEMPGPFLWDPASPSAIVAREQDLTMIVPSTFGERHGAIVVRRTNGRWAASLLRLENLYYARVLPLRGDTLLMAYVASGNPDGNTLYVRRMTTRGDTIGARARVSVPGAGAVYDPMLVAVGDSLIHLAWTTLDSTKIRSRLSLAASRDSGRTWQHFTSLLDPGGFDIPATAVDPRGRLHVVARSDRDGMPQPIHALWTGAAWRRSTVPPAPEVFNAGTPFLLFSTGERYHLSWGAAGFGDTIFAAPVSVVSTGRETCVRDEQEQEQEQEQEREDARGLAVVGRVEHRVALESGSSWPLPVRLGTHFSVRGAASPRAVHRHDQRGINASISNHRPGPAARSAGRRRPRVRGPPRHAPRAGG